MVCSYAMENNNIQVSFFAQLANEIQQKIIFEHTVPYSFNPRKPEEFIDTYPDKKNYEYMYMMRDNRSQINALRLVCKNICTLIDAHNIIDVDALQKWRGLFFWPSQQVSKLFNKADYVTINETFIEAIKQHNEPKVKECLKHPYCDVVYVKNISKIPTCPYYTKEAPFSCMLFYWLENIELLMNIAHHPSWRNTIWDDLNSNVLVIFFNEYTKRNYLELQNPISYYLTLINFLVEKMSINGVDLSCLSPIEYICISTNPSKTMTLFFKEQRNELVKIILNNSTVKLLKKNNNSNLLSDIFSTVRKTDCPFDNELLDLIKTAEKQKERYVRDPTVYSKISTLGSFSLAGKNNRLTFIKTYITESANNELYKEIQGPFNFSLLDYLCKINCPESDIYCELLDFFIKNYDVNSLNYKLTPLMLALNSFKLITVEKLLEADASITKHRSVHPLHCFYNTYIFETAFNTINTYQLIDLEQENNYIKSTNRFDLTSEYIGVTTEMLPKLQKVLQTIINQVPEKERIAFINRKNEFERSAFDGTLQQLNYYLRLFFHSKQDGPLIEQVMDTYITIMKVFINNNIEKTEHTLGYIATFNSIIQKFSHLTLLQKFSNYLDEFKNNIL